MHTKNNKLKKMQGKKVNARCNSTNLLLFEHQCSVAVRDVSGIKKNHLQCD